MDLHIPTRYIEYGIQLIFIVEDHTFFLNPRHYFPWNPQEAIVSVDNEPSCYPPESYDYYRVSFYKLC